MSVSINIAKLHYGEFVEFDSGTNGSQIWRAKNSGNPQHERTRKVGRGILLDYPEYVRPFQKTRVRRRLWSIKKNKKKTNRQTDKQTIGAVWQIQRPQQFHLCRFVLLMRRGVEQSRWEGMGASSKFRLVNAAFFLELEAT